MLGNHASDCLSKVPEDLDTVGRAVVITLNNSLNVQAMAILHKNLR